MFGLYLLSDFYRYGSLYRILFNIYVLHVKGILEAFAFPALNHMISMWVPEKEKSAFVSFAYVGGTFGSIITNPMCGAILATIGWEVS